LWIDYELLRKHQKQTIIHDASAVTNNRHLALADLALGTTALKRKTKAAAKAAKAAKAD